MRFYSITLVLLVFTFFSNHKVAEGGANGDQKEVELVLAEIRNLLIEHYNIPPATKRARPSPEALAEAELLDDIRLTVGQAKRILQRMKQRWGYEIKEERITPNESLFWTFPIKYAFNGSAHTEEQKNIIRHGFQLWANNTCVEFEEHENVTELKGQPHIFVINATGCWSSIGMMTETDGQELSIGPNCDRVAKAAHEMGHALGLDHEQTRPDRDEHVTLIWENIIPGKEHNFFMSDDWDPAATPYDVTSVMHYDSLGFSIDGKKRVIVPHDIHQLTAIGQRARLQFNDIKRINYAYKCIERKCSDYHLPESCQNGGYQDPKNCYVCRCPPGFFGDYCDAIEPAHGDGMGGCGGEVTLEPCEIRTLRIPTYPKTYAEDTSCTWRIRSRAKGLAFAFQSRPDMPCSSADTCYDYVEIRTNMSSPTTPGKFFCACGESKGRIVKVDETAEALVRWASTTLVERGGAGVNIGFLLNVYSTCNDTLASEMPNSCTITTTGYESCSGVSLPICDGKLIDVYEPPIVVPTSTPKLPAEIGKIQQSSGATVATLTVASVIIFSLLSTCQ